MIVDYEVSLFEALGAVTVSDSGLILRRIGGVKSGLSLTTPLCSEGMIDAILHVDGSGWLVRAEAEAESTILEPNAPPESLLQKRRF